MNKRELLLNCYYLLKNNNTLDCLKQIEKTQYLSLEDIRKIQYKKLKKLIIYAHNNVPFYRNLFNDINFNPNDFKSIKDMEKIPILNKKNINVNHSRMLSLCYSKKFLKPNSTGGSTGQNLKFHNDLKTAYIRQAFVMRGNKWAGLNLGVKHVSLWGSPFDSSLNKSFVNRFINKMMGYMFLSSYELTDINMVHYLEKMVKFEPQVLTSYPSSLYEFSKFIENSGINPPPLKSIITSGETLYNFQREKIESVFSCSIYNRYGCREFGPIAHECDEHNGLHMNLEHLYIEFLDPHDNKVTNGDESSKIVITDLDNYAMPLIRYEIGDIGEILENKCNCGRNLPLIKVEGRTFDVIIGTNGNRLGGTFWTLLFRTYINGVEEFQVIQESKEKIRINIVTTNEFNNNDLILLKNKIHKCCGSDMDINFKLVDYINRSQSGKLRFIINRCNYGN